jgi:hypothetical protein
MPREFHVATGRADTLPQKGQLLECAEVHMIRRRYIKAAVPLDEYSSICTRADAEGLTLAGYLRVAVARDEERTAITQTMEAIRAVLPGSQSPASKNPLVEIEPTLDELLQLVRLLASRVDPQAAARISATTKNKFFRKDEE